jgi:hypothetical protein
MHFVLTRFYQNVGQVVHEGYQARRRFYVAPFVQPLTYLPWSHLQPCSPELIHHCLNNLRVSFELSDDVRSNSEGSIVTALFPIETQLCSDVGNALPRQTKLVTDLLVSE